MVWGLSFSWWSLPVVVLVASANWDNPQMSIATLFFSMWLLGLFSEQLRYIPQALNQLGSALSASDRVLRVLKAPRMDRHFIPEQPRVVGLRTRDSEPPPRLPASLVLNDVTVELGGRVLIEHMNLSFNLNQRTAIIGRLGSGKSVLLSLLTGERAPTAGTCIVHFSDGSSGSLWEESTYKDYRQVIASSQQQPFLSNTSLLRNIDLGGCYPESDVEQACSQAQLNADIALLKRGLHEEVGEHGINLSGGQKQRVSIARAFMARRPLLILDDPLSAVDVKTESALATEIFESSSGMIIVSHRLTELVKCDRILVLEAGRVIEDGDPTTLLAANGAFSQFLKAFELTYE
jgi:ATP-binding cassette, subfamily B, multidrug efflux pump